MDDEVLQRSFRGHTSAQVEKSSELIIGAGFSLGLQMMIGLPGDTEEKALHTAHEILRLGASETRIYPVLVISGTELEKLYNAGKYFPLDLDEAIRWTKQLVLYFESSGIKILRIGLHPSEELVNKGALVAGPFHPSFRELVMTAIWNDRFLSENFSSFNRSAEIRVNPADLNNAVGYSGKNRKLFEDRFSSVKFTADPSVPEKCYHADYL
jgi:histone acetyltransferase (RNA polymerase elongator complex component)